MDSQDFIPSEAKIEASTSYIFEGVKNLAGDEEIAAEIRRAIDDFEARYDSQRDMYTGDDGIWSLCDWAFRCCINDDFAESEKSIGANVPEVWSRAKTGTTQFYRQVTQKASNAYAVLTSKDMPFKYSPLNDEVGSMDRDMMKADRMNLLAKWSMKKDKFSLKSIDFLTQIYKYGNIPVMVEWVQRVDTRKIPVPQFDNPDDPTEVTGYEDIENEYVVENRPVLTILPVESVKADISIGDIQTQDCVIVSSVVGMAEIIDGMRVGIYRDDMLEDLKKKHQWDGYTGFENNEDKDDNRDNMLGIDKLYSGRYLKREVFIRAPIDLDKEEWDEKKYIPELYRVTIFGNDLDSAVIARIERNQEPGDIIPIEMIHANPDDRDYLYHISPFEVIRSNISTETTLIRQIVDNNTQVNMPTMWEVQGEVMGNDRRFGPNQRFKVRSPNSIGTFTVRDVSGPSLQLLQYMKDDSNTANSIDKNMVGESFGARTSASEATTISSNSRRPNLVNIEYVLDQLLSFYAWRLKKLWEAYGRPEQTIQITDKNDNPIFIRPKDIVGEFDIVVDIIDDIKENELKAQRMINYAQVVATTPMVNTVDWTEFNRSLAEYMMGTDKFVTGANDEDAKAMAMQNLAVILNGGQFPNITPNMNLKTHLGVYEAERMKWRGFEDQNQNVAILDAVIQQVKDMIAQPPQIAAPGGNATITGQPTEALIAGQAASGALGGVQ